MEEHGGTWGTLEETGANWRFWKLKERDFEKKYYYKNIQTGAILEIIFSYSRGRQIIHTIWTLISMNLYFLSRMKQ